MADYLPPPAGLKGRSMISIIPTCSLRFVKRQVSIPAGGGAAMHTRLILQQAFQEHGVEHVDGEMRPVARLVWRDVPVQDEDGPIV